MCAFLDPRVKGTPYLSVSQRSALHDKIYAKVTDFSKHLPSLCTDKADNNDSNTQSGKLTSLLGSQYSDSPTGNSVDGCLIWLEIKNYLREAPCKMESSPLEW